ncbi:MAG: chromate resistance protein ChrB domain-containing protein [Thermodesulfobacteriota bacterium]
MKWITRENAKVDRIACPWLIKRFIDLDAEFLIVSKDKVLSEAERHGAIPFDVAGAELGHVDGRCSFESLTLKYGLTEDPALARMARIVHAADVPADLDYSPEGAGLKAIAHGFALLHGINDQKKMELEFPMYDALYAWCEEEVKKGR